MKRVMFYADTFGGTTGYSKVVKEMAIRLARNPEYDVMVHEIVNCQPATKHQNVTIVTPFGPRGSEVFMKSVLNNIRVFNPDIFIPISDPFLLTRDGIDKIGFKNIKVLPYVMLDGIGVPDHSKPILDKSDFVITAAEHSKKQFEAEGYETHLLRHGVNMDTYAPVDKRQQRLLKLKNGIKDTNKVFLVVGRNALRKNLMANIEAFAQFKQRKPTNRATLFIHASEADKPEWNLQSFVERMKKNYDLKELDVKFSKPHALGQGIEEEKIISYFQMADYLLSAANGEGFGLPIIEAMSCKKLVIHPDNSVAPELIGDRGILVKTKGFLYAGFGVKQPLVDIEDLSEKIEEAYMLPAEEYNDKTEAAYEWVQKNCTWDIVVKELIKILNEV